MRRMCYRMSASETHMTKPMTDDAGHPSFCRELLFIRISITIDQWPWAFRKDGRNDRKNVFTKSDILFPYLQPFSTVFLLSPFEDYPCFGREVGSLLRDLQSNCSAAEPWKYMCTLYDQGDGFQFLDILIFVW